MKRHLCRGFSFFLFDIWIFVIDLKDYTKSKTLAEREILSYNEHESETNIEVVSLNVGVVGGDTLLPYVPSSVEAIISPVRGRGNSELFLRYRAMLLLQELLGCIPLVHIDDVIEAHLFCIEKPSIKGRFLCANADPTLAEIFDYYRANYPEFQVSNEYVNLPLILFLLSLVAKLKSSLYMTS